jgi:hypothetical protein
MANLLPKGGASRQRFEIDAPAVASACVKTTPSCLQVVGMRVPISRSERVVVGLPSVREVFDMGLGSATYVDHAAARK